MMTAFTYLTKKLLQNKNRAMSCSYKTKQKQQLYFL